MGEENGRKKTLIKTKIKTLTKFGLVDCLTYDQAIKVVVLSTGKDTIIRPISKSDIYREKAAEARIFWHITKSGRKLIVHELPSYKNKEQWRLDCRE